MFVKVSRNTVAAKIIEQIKELLLGDVLRPGDRLPPEWQMAEQFNVSRPSVREALRALEHAGVLETRVGDGVFVANGSTILANGLQLSHSLSHYSLQEMVETRRVIEDATVRLTIERGSRADFDNLEKVHTDSLAAVNDIEEFIRMDYAFHCAIAKAAHNCILHDMLPGMRLMMVTANERVLSTPEDCMEIAGQHAMLLELMRERDMESARDYIQIHLDDMEKSLRKHSDSCLKTQKLPLASGLLR